jgi:2-polyprenyl-3-methyl-5-hydroxy-6-metoxy-1,4-benzoquinol methylase
MRWREVATRSLTALKQTQDGLPEILHVFEVRSALDVGCGIGTWLREFDRLGVKSYLGVDGDYIDLNQLVIPRDRFKSRNLEETFNFGWFDLFCCVEVAEHLPSSVANNFVASLVKSEPIVLFSAAIHRQGGTGHVNEQWQSYWAEKFAHHGYVTLDSSAQESGRINR